jgi:hypothetical protein
MVDTLAPAAEEGRSKLRKATGSCYERRSVGVRMGQPRWSNVQRPAHEYIVCEEASPGTETSYYREENKTNE